MSKIDTAIRHVTKPGANLFAELGFSPEDAQRYQAQSRAQISRTLSLKKQLMDELVDWMKSGHLKQGKAAEILHVSHPRVSDVVNKKTSGEDRAPDKVIHSGPAIPAVAGVSPRLSSASGRRCFGPLM